MVGACGAVLFRNSKLVNIFQKIYSKKAEDISAALILPLVGEMVIGTIFIILFVVRVLK